MGASRFAVHDILLQSTMVAIALAIRQPPVVQHQCCASSPTAVSFHCRLPPLYPHSSCTDAAFAAWQVLLFVPGVSSFLQEVLAPAAGIPLEQINPTPTCLKVIYSYPLSLSPSLFIFPPFPP